VPTIQHSPKQCGQTIASFPKSRSVSFSHCIIITRFYYIKADYRFSSFVELQLGAVLGKGGYCTVSEVKKITLADNPTEAAPATKSSAPRDEHDDDLAYDELASSLGSMHISQDRKYMATRYLRHGKDARYAIKILSDDIKEDSQRFIAGVVDLAMEAKFLAVIRHPNIVKMRGMANLTPFEPGFFIVLDRLYDTMSERLKAWTKRASQLKGLGRMMDRKGEKKKEFAFDRFLVALDLCSALGFLHTNKYVFIQSALLFQDSLDHLYI